MSQRTNPIIIKWFVLFPNQNFNLFLIWCKSLEPFWLNNILLRIICQNSIVWKLIEEFDSLKLISSKFNMKLISWRDEFHMNRLILLILRWFFFFLNKKNGPPGSLMKALGSIFLNKLYACDLFMLLCLYLINKNVCARAYIHEHTCIFCFFSWWVQLTIVYWNKVSTYEIVKKIEMI